MSNTPRTDAVANDACDDTGRLCRPEILLDLCRRLEQDLKVANEFNRGLANSISEFTAKAEDARNSAKIAWQRAEKTEKQLAEMTAIAEEFEKACNHHRQRCHWEARKHYDRAISLKHNYSRLEAAKKGWSL